MLPNSKSCPRAPENLKWLLPLCRILSVFRSVWEETLRALLFLLSTFIYLFFYFFYFSLCNPNNASTLYPCTNIPISSFVPVLIWFLCNKRPFVCPLIKQSAACLLETPPLTAKFGTSDRVAQWWTGRLSRLSLCLHPSTAGGSSRPPRPWVQEAAGIENGIEHLYKSHMGEMYIMAATKGSVRQLKRYLKCKELKIKWNRNQVFIELQNKLWKCWMSVGTYGYFEVVKFPNLEIM